MGSSITQILNSNPNLPNDSKLLDGWVADVAQMSPAQLQALSNTTLNSSTKTPIDAATLLTDLQGTYTIVKTFGTPNGSGDGYFGVELKTTDANGNPVYILVDRQFRLTTGSAGDIATDIENVAADEIGIDPPGLDGAKSAVETVAQDALSNGGTLIPIGQSEGGMFAQLQQAYLQSGGSALGTALPPSMSLTINAVPSDAVINRMSGVTPSEVNGLNISATDDMFTGPHSISQNTTGTQLYVSQNNDGTFQASTTSSGSFFVIAHGVGGKVLRRDSGYESKAGWFSRRAFA